MVAFDETDLGSAWYDDNGDEFCFVLEGDGEVERYPGYERDVAGETRKLYAIGAGSWIWETYSENDGDLQFEDKVRS
jgi:hypothetical protein